MSLIPWPATEEILPQGSSNGHLPIQALLNRFNSNGSYSSLEVPRVLQTRGRVLDFVKRSLEDLEPVLAVTDEVGSTHQTGIGSSTERGRRNPASDDTSWSGSNGSQGAPVEESYPLMRNEPVVRTALCVETRGGVIHVFMPPVERIEQYLDLVSAIEATAIELSMPSAASKEVSTTRYDITASIISK